MKSVCAMVWLLQNNECKYFPNPQHESLCSRLQIESRMHNPSSTDDGGQVEFDEDNRDVSARTGHAQNDRSYNNQSRNHNQHNQSGSSNYRSSGNHRFNQRGGRPNQQVRSDFARPSAASFDQPMKKRAFELDEDGCLPFYVDKKGES